MTREEAISTLEFHRDILDSDWAVKFENYELYDALEMAIEALRNSVAYICNEKACPDCGKSDCRDCYHTTDIHHAKNFVEVAPGKWMEIYVIPPLKVKQELETQ